NILLDTTNHIGYIRSRPACTGHGNRGGGSGRPALLPLAARGPQRAPNAAGARRRGRSQPGRPYAAGTDVGAVENRDGSARTASPTALPAVTDRAEPAREAEQARRPFATSTSAP